MRQKLATKKKIEGFRRLEKFAHTVEARYGPRADFKAAIAREFAISGELGGRSAFDGLNEKPSRPKGRQLPLFGH
jgi:hypothetical protein